MKYQLKGNYFEGSFHAPQTRGHQAVEKIIHRECPSDINLELWQLPVEYRHIEPTLESVERGYRYWRKTSIEERIGYFKRLKKQFEIHKNEIAEAIAWEVGKPLWEAQTEAQALIGKIDTTINYSLPRVQEQTITDISPNTDGKVFFKPIGPAFIIGPFNFPCHLANTQILSNLLVGNSIIFKPSEKTAYSGELLIRCFHEAGFPKGTVNLIQGDGEIASRITKDKRIKAVFFTGSKEVGQKILKTTSNDVGKMVALELGGKNTAILHQDAPLTLALEEILKGSFLTTGQRCTSTALIPIHHSLVGPFIEQFHLLAKKIIIDHAVEHDKVPFMGPLVDKRAVDNYLNYMGMAKREGITEIMRGKSLQRQPDGYYVSPSIHFHETFDLNSHFLTSEIFGPNCVFIPYHDIEEAIDIANSTEFGLAASVFTQDQTIFEKCLMDIDSGLVNLNRATCGAHARLPFGGVKSSGNHRPAAIATIDACVFQQSSLVYKGVEGAGLNTIKGLMED